MSSVVISGDTSGAITLSAPAVAGTNTITLPASTGTIMVNGPAFSAYASASQNVTTSTWTKVTLNTEVFDTNNNFDSTTNYRFTPTVAGYYQINAGIYCSNASTYDTAGSVGIYKNGSIYQRATLNFSSQGAAFNDFLTTTSAVISMNGSTDYIELYGRITAGGTPSIVGGTTYDTFMNGCMIRSA
jgi:hypothetical protein